ncbi:PhzF family phenazine biosynthesis protein [Nocardioides sp. C4-1]|uniref:PhzF family phenazine biosynthesis protein n=1 Tax=Nocardioides sp. C4-1 TaxID=3151851 RepID=UPI0032651F5B
MTVSLPFRQVDVFSHLPLLGNPVAVVHDADGVSSEQMAAFARWTNLSETTFLLAPTTPEADYRLRIFTPTGELPFAGHPTLGSAHAWLEAGGVPRGDDLVQECGAGLVTVRRGERLAFRAPPLVRSGPVDDADLATIVAALGIADDDVVDAAWIDNGPGWTGVLLRSAEAVLACRPGVGFGGLKAGVVGPYPEGTDGHDGCAVEVRAFYDGFEDPVTGSLNAGIAQWLGGRVLPSSYVASQGTVLQRRGRVHVTGGGGEVWVGGDTSTTITGTVGLGD